MGLLLSSKGAVTLLPEELSGPEEGLGVFELPSHDVTPLVQLDGQVTVGLYPGRVGRVHY